MLAIILAIPAIILFGIATLQAMRRHWHNALTLFLGSVVFLLLFTWEEYNCANKAIAQARQTVILQLHQEIKTLKLAQPTTTNTPHANN